jgi:hypothetical protein
MVRSFYTFDVKTKKKMEQINLNSGQIEIISPYGRVYLYTHNYAKTLVSDVHRILSRRKRWDDPDYLSRMIFCEMIPAEFWESDTGFGIGTQMYTDVNLLVSIDTVRQTISISSYGSGVDDMKMTILDFVENFYKSAEL